MTEDNEQKAGILLDDKIVGIWYLQITPTQDWMATLRELVPDEKYELVYRFRYYEDDKVFDSEDRKYWYRGVVSGTRNFCILGIRNAGKKMQTFASGKLHETLNETGDLQDFMKRFEAQTFVFMRMLSPEEAKAQC